MKVRTLTIDTPVPEKVTFADIYSFIKTSGLVWVMDMGLYIRDRDGCWHAVSDNEAKLQIRGLFSDSSWQPILTDSLMRSLIQSLKTDPELQRRGKLFCHEDLIKFDNGIWKISERTWISASTRFQFKRMIHVKVPDNMPKESEEFLNFCAKVFTAESCSQKKQALYEIIGYAISDIGNIKKAIFLIGPANCGKSVILRFIQRLIGEENVSNVPFASFAQRFSVAQMHRKVLNISGEVPSGTLPSRALDVFKNITGGDRMELERKGGQPFSAVITAKLLFAGNTLPTFNNVDGTDALIRRLHILRFDKEVEENERDCMLEEKLWNDKEIIVRYALEALWQFVSRNRTFITLDDETQLLQALAHVANPITYFLESCMEYGESYAVHISDAYEAYFKLARNEGLPELDRSTFRNLMTTQPNIHIGRTKKRLGKKSPKICFEGIQLIENKIMSDKGQDTGMNDKGRFQYE